MKLKYLSFFFIALVLSSCNKDGIVPPPTPEVISMDMDPVVSPSGRYIVYLHATIDTTDTSGLYILDLDTGEKTLLLSGDVRNPDFSPDGRWLVFNVGAQIFKVRLREDMSGVDSSTLRQLTFEGRNYFPAWSPDGNLIAFDSNREGNGYDIWLMDIYGQNQRMFWKWGRHPDWSPDGTELLFIGVVDSVSYGVIVDTSLSDTLLVNIGAEPAWSPDGEWIAYTWSYEMEGGIRLYSVPGDSTISLIDIPAMDPSWFPDSRTLVFSALNSEKTKFVLWRINIDGSGLEQITF